MSKQVTPDIDEALKNAMAKLKEDSIKQEEALEKKFWSPISVPLQLREVLTQRTKPELDKIRRTLALKGVSSLKKAELIDLLVEALPQHLNEICQQLDNGRFGLLTYIVNNGGHMIAPAMEKHHIDFFLKMGLIVTGTLDGKKIVAVPDDFIAPLNALQKDEQVQAIISRNTEWISLTHGLVYYYGTLIGSQLMEMVESYTKGAVSFGEFYPLIEKANVFYNSLQINEHGFSHRRVFDPRRVKQEHAKRKNVGFYPFTKDQLMKAGVLEFVDRNQSYMEMVQFLVKNFKINKVDADMFVEECVHATKIGESPNAVMTYLSRHLEFPNTELFQHLSNKVVHLMNNTREWFLKGHTSSELMVEERKHLRQLPEKNRKAEGKAVTKVGRNELCPCSSGKKYKKCCGK